MQLELFDFDVVNSMQPCAECRRPRNLKIATINKKIVYLCHECLTWYPKEMKMRLSDKCNLNGCDKPHFRLFSHIDTRGTRHNFCCEEHQIAFMEQELEKKNLNGTKIMKGS